MTNVVTLQIYFDENSKNSSFLHGDQRSAVNKSLEDFFQDKFTLEANPIWQRVEVLTPDRVTVFVTLDQKFGVNTIENGVREIFENAPSPNGGPVRKRDVIVHF